jgi:WhiB family redox-sensing transcriptional regulator
MTLTTFSFDEVEVAALVHDPGVVRRTWAERANCLAIDPDVYFPDDGETPPSTALACCAACPVALHCLATALFHEMEDDLRFGWWGGIGPDERRALWQRLEGTVASPEAATTDDPVTRALRLRAHRRTIPTIAAELGCSERTVYRILAAHAA